MKLPAENPNRKAPVTLLLVLGYLCVLGLAANMVVRAGWVHARLVGLNGFSSTLWKWTLGGAICFALSWYIERLGRRVR